MTKHWPFLSKNLGVLRNLANGERTVALRQTIRRFGRARSGVAAAEFALMIPVMMTIWVGMVVATDALNADKKVTVLARTLADMTTQMQAVSQTDLDSIFLATETVMWPQPADDLGMRITSIDIDGAGKVFVDWSVVPSVGSLKGSFAPLSRCSTYAKLPEALKTPRTSIVLAEVAMNYQASVVSDIVDELFKGTSANGEFKLGDMLFMRPRQSTKVLFNPPPSSKCPGYVT